MNDKRLTQKQIEFLNEALTKITKYLVEVQITHNDKGTWFVQFPTIEKGVPVVESFLVNTPFYIAALLDEVERLRSVMQDVYLKSSDKGEAEVLLNDIEKMTKQALEEPPVGQDVPQVGEGDAKA